MDRNCKDGLWGEKVLWGGGGGDWDRRGGGDLGFGIGGGVRGVGSRSRR